MDNQEAFDKVVRHLYTMDYPSSQRNVFLGERICAYRGDDEAKCAIGCLIPDEVYQKGMEAMSLPSLIANYTSIEELFLGVNWKLLSDLQHVHDDSNSWFGGPLRDKVKVRERLRAIAQRYDVDPGRVGHE